MGSKTAERIIVDLRDKIKAAGNTLITVTPVSSDAYDEALSALCMLGYTKAGAQKALKKLFSEDPAMKVEVAIKKALAMM